LLPFYEIAANQQQLMIFLKISSNQLSEFMRFEKIAATQDEFPLFYIIAQILMCDLLFYYFLE